MDPSGSIVKSRFGRVVKSTSKPEFIYGDESVEYQSAVFTSKDRTIDEAPFVFSIVNPSGSSRCFPSRFSPCTSLTNSFSSTSIRKDYE